MSSVQNERNADGSKAEVALYPSEAAPFYLAAALIDSAGRTINSISGTKPGFKGDFQFSITARCGNLKETLRPELVKNHAHVDFWVK